MASLRKPFQGVTNILRFNWHFYILSAALILALYILSLVFNTYKLQLSILGVSVILASVASIASSYFIYDLSDLYRFEWLPVNGTDKNLVNISAGFDEISDILIEKYPGAKLSVLEFYDPMRHREASIKRARKAYPRYPGTKKVETCSFPLKTDIADKVFVMLSAHEIRSPMERINFFKEIRRVMKHDGQLIVIEHLRNTVNFFAFNIGFFHFYSRTTWLDVFGQTDLLIREEIKITPFITAFILEKHGNSL